MAYETLNLGIELTLPTSGTSNWGPTEKATTWSKISSHSHTGSGDGNKIGHSALAPNYGYTQAAVVTPTGTTQTLNWNLGNVQRVDLSSATGDVTLTLSNPNTGAVYYITLTQGATFRDIVWPATVKWPQGQKALLSSGAGKVDMVKLYWNGTQYLSTWELDFS